MLTIEELKEKTWHQLSSLKYQLTPEGEAEYQGRKVPKKEKINAKINTTQKLLTQIEKYQSIQIGDYVCNGKPKKIGEVFAKEIQNSLPVIWVNWYGQQKSHLPDSLTIVPSTEHIDGWLKAQGESIFFGEESDYVLTGQKTVIRRNHQDKQAETFCQYYRERKLIQIFDFKGGKRIGWLKLTTLPYLETLRDMPSSDLEAEGGTCQTVGEYVKRYFDGDGSKLVWVIRFEFYPEAENSTSQISKNKVKVIEDDIRIDPEFKNLLRPLTPTEYEQLEQNLIRDGSSIITVWKNHNVIIDGHHTYEISLKHNIPFSVHKIELADRSDVINWMYQTQLGRRNLTEKEKSCYRARLYNSLKKERGGDRRSRLAKRERGSLVPRERKSEKSKGHNDPLKKSTAQIVGEKTGVSEKTIKRDVKYSEAVDEIADKTGISPQDVLSSELSKKQVQEVSAQSPEVIKQKLANPKSVQPRELPKLKIGQLIQIKSDRTNKDLIGYNKSYAVVKRLNRNCADIDVWGKLLIDVHLQFLYPVEDKVAICANVTPEFLLSIMANYESFDSAVTQIPINKYHQGEKVKVCRLPN